MSIYLIGFAALILALSGLPGALASRQSPFGQRAAAACLVVGGIVGIGGVIASLMETAGSSLLLPWSPPWTASESGGILIANDSLSAIFLLPIFVVPALGAVYGLGYWKQDHHQENGRLLGLFFGLLAGSMAVVVIARDALLFLTAWEVMALSAYFASTVEIDDPEVRRAGWIYIVATHTGTLCLFAMFALWRHGTGSFALQSASSLPESVADVIFVLAVVGFGFKAGLMPLHVWLPGAHANAPSHVSAVMSGVMLKMGVYGIVRMTAILPAASEWWGGVLLAAGIISAIAGIAFAIGQRDLKRVLAYSSIENIGVIAMGLGVAIFGRVHERGDWVVLGLGGALLHMMNHALFKSLLFFNAGAIIHSTHTREIDRLGGLARAMPRTMALFLVGAIAICALPPLNGFAGEWLIYLSLFSALSLGGSHGFPAGAVAAASLAMVGAMALACFVRLLGTVFLGSPRSSAGDGAHDPEPSMILPMVLLGGACIGIGLAPGVTAPLLDAAAATWIANSPTALTPLHQLAPMEFFFVVGPMLAILAGAVYLTFRLLSRAQVQGETVTWDCGYAKPSRTMQYTGSSFGQSLVGLFSFLLRPIRRRPVFEGYFPKRDRFETSLPDVVLDRMITPVFQFADRILPRMRALQQGQTQVYVLYIVLILIALLLGSKIGSHQ